MFGSFLSGGEQRCYVCKHQCGAFRRGYIVMGLRFSEARGADVDLFHRSGPNVSDETRMAYEFSYTVPGGSKQPGSVFPVLRHGVVA